MKAYWKIPKEWVQEWGLSPAEALVLSDIKAWPNCGHEERAKRVGLSPRQLTRIKDKMSSDVRTKCLIELGQNVLRKRTKCPKIKKEKESSPTPPIKKNKNNIEEQEELTLDKSNVPNADASAGKKTSQKKEKKEEPKVYTIQHRCRTFFETIYEQKKGDKYYYAAKDAAALKQLLNKIRFLMPEEQKKDEAKLEDNFQIFINTIFHSKILGAWITDNLSLPIINDKFNEIYSQLKNGKSSSNAADNFHVFGSRNITPDILDEFA